MKPLKWIWGSLPAGTYRKDQEIELSESMKYEGPNIIEYTSLVEIIKLNGWPDEYLVHPEDFTVMLQKFGRPMYVGFDERGMFMFVGLTRIRPSRDVESLNWS